MVRGVIFDMDGLMFDTERVSTILWGRTGEILGFPIPREVVDRFRGKNKALIRQTLIDEHGSEFDFEKADGIKVQLEEEYYETQGVPVKKGLMELLEYLKAQGIPAAVATSTNRGLAEKMLKLAGVYPYFHTVVYGDMVEKSKPAPDIFQKAAEELGVANEECLVLEDSTAGVLAGKAAGGYTIHIPDVLAVPEDAKKGITAELESLDLVIGWIQQMNDHSI